MLDPWILAFSLVTVAATIWMGFRSARSSKSAADFFVAGRSVSVGWNASAISGEYLSAASFMGVAGMVMSSGYDALWYPVCYACGYLFLLLFIAGPLRRFGAYTIPDFAEGRYDSPVFRKIAVLFVLFIGFFYTMPQMKGAGTTLAYVFKDIEFFGQKGLPYWVGVVVVGAVITLNVALGGMKGITLVQPFQYWMIMFAISVPIFVLASVYGGYGKQLKSISSSAIPHAGASPVATITPYAVPGPNIEAPTLYFQLGGMHRGFSPLKNLWVDFRGLERRMMVSLPAATYSLPDLLLNYAQSHVWHRGITRVSGFIAQEISNRQVTYSQPRPLTRLEFDELVQKVLAENGITLIHVTPEIFKAVPTKSAAKYGVAFREGQSGKARNANPGKAPADSTWLNPFGPLTTKAAKAATNVIRPDWSRRSSLAEPDPIGAGTPEWRLMLADRIAQVKGWFGARGDQPATETRVKYETGDAGKPLSELCIVLQEWAQLRHVRCETDLLNRLIVFNAEQFQSPQDLVASLEKAMERQGITLIHATPKEWWAVSTPNLKSFLKPMDVKPYALLYTYSLIIALVCGTAGLPHILVRFYTNPDGVAAKRTTMWVMILIGIFYVFPPVFGVMGRNLMPALYDGSGVNGTDGIVLKLPTVLGDRFGPLGSILSGITCAGAFAAFMSTFSGLLVSMTGALAHDVYGRILRPQSTPEQRLRMFKFAAILIGGVAILLGTLVENFEINFMVGQAFAIAAASYFPLLFMSVWWRGMTVRGAATGMLSGGLLAVAAISLTSWTTFITTQAAKFKTLGRPEPAWFAALKPYSLSEFWAAHPLLRILGEQPALWAVPLAILLMILVSRLTRHTVPRDIREKMLVLHAPEALGLRQDYIRDHEAAH